MNKLKENILNCLKDIKGSGKFVSIQSTKFVFPGLEVAGIGEIAYPINEAQAKALIQQAHKAHFGKGSETILDTNVRSGWEINADKLTFKGNRWEGVIAKIVSQIKPELGLEDYTISAHLYKLLIYEEGDFFLSHKDSEKEKGMFGTLVINLPSTFTGGELVARFDGIEEVADFAANEGSYAFNYAAFYADCDHEVKPVTSGYRVYLIYNLVQQASPQKIQLTSSATHVEKLAEIFKKQSESGEGKPLIVLLGHQYTPENFSADGLKLNDRPKADVLLRAATKANCYAKLCLVTSYKSGSPKYSGYGYDDDPDEDAEMEEVYDESLYIEHWLPGDIPALSNVSFEEDDLITSFELTDGEPIVKENTGYMGNYGPDINHWYHYGAVMIWSQETNAELLQSQDTQSQLQWMDYFNKHPKMLSKNEGASIEAILSKGFKDDRHSKTSNYNAIADWIIISKNESFFLKLNEEQRELYFTKIDAGHWLKLIAFFPAPVIDGLFNLLTQNLNAPIMSQLLAILRMLQSSGNNNSHIVAAQLKQMPQYFSAWKSSANNNKDFLPTATILQNLFWLEKTLPQSEAWIKSIAEALTASKKRKYINNVLVPQLLDQKENTKLICDLLHISQQCLQEKVNNKPQPPVDWKREMPDTANHKKQWQLLKDFIESPDEKVFDYRKNQSERSELETAINNVEIDLKTETIKKGSPHILRITKTQAAYQRKMKEWDEDVVLLGKVISKIGK